MLQKQFRCFCGPQGLNRLFEHSESEHLPEHFFKRFVSVLPSIEPQKKTCLSLQATRPKSD